MRIIHVKSSSVLPEEARRKLENLFYLDSRTAVAEIRAYFPNHVVSHQNGNIRVTNRDGSFTVALFREELGGF